MDMNEAAWGRTHEASDQAAGATACPEGQLRVARGSGVVVGELLALVEQGQVPVVSWSDEPHRQGVRARSTVDLKRPHIGQAVVLVFDQGDPARPIVTGVLRPGAVWPLPDQPATVEVDADGERMVLRARHELVLQCGRARLVLREDGHIELKGERITSAAQGAHRILGGSVQLN